MKSNKSESVRHRQSMKDTMLRYQGEIKRLVDAAIIVCNENGGSESVCSLGCKCPFGDARECWIEELKDLIGEKE